MPRPSIIWLGSELRGGPDLVPKVAQSNTAQSEKEQSSPNCSSPT